MPLPAGLRLADRLAEPMFTPSTKAEEGHDLNIDFAAAVDLVGRGGGHPGPGALPRPLRAGRPRGWPRPGSSWPTPSSSWATSTAVLCLCDEVVTPGLLPPLAGRRGGPRDARPPAFDKQPLRDWAAAQDWDKRPPPPPLPDEVVAATSARYVGRLRAGHRAPPGRLVRCGGDEVRGPGRGAASRPGIADPEGATIERALPALGFDEVARRAGRPVLPLRGRGRRRGARPAARAEELAHRLLANPVIEESRLELVAAGGRGAR